MSKDDIEIPAEIPVKRRHLENALDAWLAIWIASPDTTPSQRRRLADERQRRKDLRGRENRSVLLVVGPEGTTPRQKLRISEMLRDGSATTMSRVSSAAADVSERIKTADLVIATPREMSAPADVQVRNRSSVWLAIDYAKHRKVAVKIILADGSEGSLG